MVDTPVRQRKTTTNRRFTDSDIDVDPDTHEQPKKCCKSSQCGILKPDCGKKQRKAVISPCCDCDSMVKCQNVQTNTRQQESHETQCECPKSKRIRSKFSRRRFRSGSDINLRPYGSSDMDYNEQRKSLPLRKSDRTRLNLQNSLRNTKYESQNDIKPVSRHKTTSTSDSEHNISVIHEKIDKNKKYDRNLSYLSTSKSAPKNSRRDSPNLNHFQTSARRTTAIKQNGDKLNEKTINKTNDKHSTVQNNHNLKEAVGKESYIPPKYDPNQKQIENPHFLESFEETKPQSVQKEHFAALKNLIPFHKRKTTKPNVPELVKTSKQEKRDTTPLKLSKIEPPTNQETIEPVKLSTNNEKTKELKDNKNKFNKNKTKNDFAALDDFTTPIKYSFYKTRKENNLEKEQEPEESIYPPSDEETNEEPAAKTIEEDKPRNNKNQKHSVKINDNSKKGKEKDKNSEKTNEEHAAKTTEEDKPRNSKNQKQSVKINDNSKKTKDKDKNSKKSKDNKENSKKSKDNKENLKKSKDNKENNSKKNKDNKENSKKSKDNKESKSMLGKLFFFPTAHRKKKLENQKKSIFKRMHSGQSQIHRRISYEEKFIVTAEITPKKTYIRNSRKKISETGNNIDNNKIVSIPRNKSLPATACCEENNPTDAASFSKMRRNFSTGSRRVNEICGRCNKKVYIMERCIADNGVFHKKCFTCFFCKKTLDSLSVVPKLNEILCKQCYMRFYGPQLYGFGMKQNLMEI